MAEVSGKDLSHVNYYLHSKNIDKITVLPEDFDPAGLNHLEQLGLYLIGRISRGKLAELWNHSGYLDGNEVVAAVWEAVKKFVGRGDLCGRK